jgi:hypothetical protein
MPQRKKKSFFHTIFSNLWCHLCQPLKTRMEGTDLFLSEYVYSISSIIKTQFVFAKAAMELSILDYLYKKKPTVDKL